MRISLPVWATFTLVYLLFAVAALPLDEHMHPRLEAIAARDVPQDRAQAARLWAPSVWYAWMYMAYRHKSATVLELCRQLGERLEPVNLSKNFGGSLKILFNSIPLIWETLPLFGFHAQERSLAIASKHWRDARRARSTQRRSEFVDLDQRSPKSMRNTLLFCGFFTVGIYTWAAIRTNTETDAWVARMRRKVDTVDDAMLHLGRYIEISQKLEAGLLRLRAAVESLSPISQRTILDAYIAVGEAWLNAPDSRKACWAICALNASIFIAWKIPALQHVMLHHFVHRPLARHPHGLLTSIFSHQSSVHLAMNCFTLSAVGMNKYIYHTDCFSSQAYVNILTAGLFASLVPHVVRLRIYDSMRSRLSGKALQRAQADVVGGGYGSSGAVYACLVVTALGFPELNVNIMFFPYPIAIQTAMGGLVMFDLIGMARPWGAILAVDMVNNTISIGNTQVARVGHGLMLMTWTPTPVPDEQCFESIKAGIDALPADVKMFVNAGEFYAQDLGTANLEMLARFLAKYPDYADRMFLSVKAGLNPKTFGADSSPEALAASVENIGRILGPYKKMDLFQPARVDHRFAIEDTMRVLAAFVADGKVAHIGLSECKASTLRRAHAIHPVAVVEVEISPFMYEDEAKAIVQASNELGVVVAAYAPLGHGILTGALKSLAQIPEGDMRRQFTRLQDENLKHNLVIVDELQTFAQSKGITVAQLCLGWVAALGSLVMPLPGSSKATRTVENVKAGDVDLSAEDVATMNDITGKHGIKGDRVNGMSAEQLNLWG
ncbi:Aldo-ket-red domain-containing protein [Mycena kentingensis (nom. inval.)]|nr:Aldo-ket-red domain-containing protein [Mycena kentingensis (nom. inval.)]